MRSKAPPTLSESKDQRSVRSERYNIFITNLYYFYMFVLKIYAWHIAFFLKIILS